MTCGMGTLQARKEYERRINKAMDFIAANLFRNPSLDEIAAAAAFSKFHFHRLFQTHVGETVLEFTRRLKLEKAAAQLHFDQAKDITSIALDCGFSSSQNFAKAFKKHFAISPTVYRATDVYSNNDANRKNGNALSKGGNIDGKGGNAHAGGNDLNHNDLSNRRYEKEEKIVTIEVKEIPERNVAYVRTIGEYGFEPAKMAFKALTQWADPRGHLENGLCLGLAWDNPCVTPSENCRYDACITIPEGTEVKGEADHQIVPAGKYAINRTHVYNNNFQQGWDDLIGEWLPSSGYQPADGPVYEVYVDMGKNHPDGRWIVDIHLPVKPL